MKADVNYQSCLSLTIWNQGWWNQLRTVDIQDIYRFGKNLKELFFLQALLIMFEWWTHIVYPYIPIYTSSLHNIILGSFHLLYVLWSLFPRSNWCLPPYWPPPPPSSFSQGHSCCFNTLYIVTDWVQDQLKMLFSPIM